MSDTDWNRVRSQWQALLRDVLGTMSLKQMAADLGVTVSAISHAAAGHGKHAFHADWLPYLVAKAPNDDVVAFLASLRGLTVVDPPKLSPEEELRALKASLHKHLGEDLRRIIVNGARAGR